MQHVSKMCFLVKQISDVSPSEKHNSMCVSKHVPTTCYKGRAKCSSRKDPTCPVCQRADGPVGKHKGSHTELKQTHILTVDLMGPFPPRYPKKFKYALVGAYRGRLAETGLPSPLLPLSTPIKNKEGKEVAEGVRKAMLMIESLHTGIYEEGKRILVVFSDRGSEFMNRHVTDI
eukprot:921240-Amphidinium_carterae.1